MKKVLILVISLIFTGSLAAESLIEIDLKPIKKIAKIDSLALFRFDGKLINSGRINLVNYLDISYNYHKYLLKRFSSLDNLKIVDSDIVVSFAEQDKLGILRGDNISEYDEKIFGTSTVISKDPVKIINSFLCGRINKYYEGRSFETSYVDLTIYLVDSKSKVILWTTGIRGCLQNVSDAIINIITTGNYTEPSIKDTEEFGWINPYKARVHNWSLQYRRGYLMTIGKLGKRVDNGWDHHFALEFKLPLWNQYNLYNQIEFIIINSLNTLTPNDPLKNYTFTTFLPLMFNFIYKFDNLVKLQNLVPFAKAGIGGSYNNQYYSGLTMNKDSVGSYNAVFNLGIGAEYRFNILDISNWRFRTDKLGAIIEINYLRWLGTEIPSGAIDLSFGLKYYF